MSLGKKVVLTSYASAKWQKDPTMSGSSIEKNRFCSVVLQIGESTSFNHDSTKKLSDSVMDRRNVMDFGPSPHFICLNFFVFLSLYAQLINF
jgi:hypothetical protein